MVGAVLGLLAGLGNRVLMKSDLVKAECDIDTNCEASGEALTNMCTFSPFVLMIVLISLNVLVGAVLS